MSEKLRWKMLDGGFGIEIDYDLAKPMIPEFQEEFHALFAEHNLIVFRHQNITKDDQVRFMGHLGPALDDIRDFGLVSNVRRGGTFGTQDLEFHSDNIFMEEPILGASLYALDVIDGASSTKFASTARAYQTMPETLRERLRGLEAVQLLPYKVTKRDRAKKVSKDNETRPSFIRPIVINHRTTGVPMICLTALNADRIVGLPHRESEQLIEEIFSYLYAPDNIHEHWWCNNDVVIWDNLATQHARRSVKDVGPRTLQRVAIGTTGYNVQEFADAPREEEIYLQA